MSAPWVKSLAAIARAPAGSLKFPTKVPVPSQVVRLHEPLAGVQPRTSTFAWYL